MGRGGKRRREIPGHEQGIVLRTSAVRELGRSEFVVEFPLLLRKPKQITIFFKGKHSSTRAKTFFCP